MNFNLQSLVEKYAAEALHYAPKLIMALLVLVIGIWLANRLAKLIAKTLNKKGIDVSLQSFLSSLISVALKVIVLITVAGMLGIQTTSFVAILGAMGLAVGLALQGSLANFAGGVLTLIFKPYKVGDLIESQGQTGWVKEIQIFNTVLTTPENKTVILPNGAVSNNTIINLSKENALRVDIVMAVAPQNDIQKVRTVIDEVYASDPLILKEPKATTHILKMGDGMVTLAIRPYATPETYWDVYFSMHEKIKIAFEKHQIDAPVPHRVIINK